LTLIFTRLDFGALCAQWARSLVGHGTKKFFRPTEGHQREKTMTHAGISDFHPPPRFAATIPPLFPGATTGTADPGNQEWDDLETRGVFVKMKRWLVFPFAPQLCLGRLDFRGGN